MKKISTLFLSLISAILFSQFTSPGTGITYNLSSLSAAAPTVLVNNGTHYQMTANITIAAGDILLMDENTVLKIDTGVQLTVAGGYDTTATSILITSTNPPAVFKGIRFEEGSTATFKKTILEYGGGLQVLTENFLMDGCTVRFFKSGLVTGAAINFSRGNPVVKNSQFFNNDLPAVASGANQSVALEFTNNYLAGNTQLNSNRPQINMGPSGTGITKILNNTIIGNRTLTKVGGISVSSLLGVQNQVQIEGNTVTDNRYGITVAGNASSGSISNNILTNNNTENNPATGGSGISLNGSGALGLGFKIEKNQFIVVCVDEDKEAASGCSVDALGVVMKEIEQEFQLGLFDRMKATFVENGEVRTLKLQDFRNGLKNGDISKNIEVYDFSKNTYVAFLSDFLLPLRRRSAGIYIN